VLRATSVLDYACAADQAIGTAILETHIAVEEYGRIVGISEDVAERLGFPVRRLVGRRLAHRVLAADRNAYRTFLRSLAGDPSISPFVIRLRSKAESILTVTFEVAARSRAAGMLVSVLKSHLPTPPRHP